MTAIVILNPYAARWDALKRRPEVEAALRTAGVAFELVLSQGHDHAIKLASEAILEGYRPIIAAGGDGLIGEVVNGIAQAAGEGAWVPLGVFPLGTANDFVDNLGLPKDIASAARAIAAAETRVIDVCQVNHRYFVNNSGIGLEPYITIIQRRMKKLRGTLRYLLATLRGIFDNPAWEMRLQWDQGEYHGPVTLVSAGNCARTGGIFYTVPHADPADGKLSFVHGFLPSRLQILQTLPKTMRPDEGNYVEHPAVHEVDTTWLKVSTDPPTPLHADGEVISESIQELEFRVVPSKLPVLVANS